jgi:hypothetical protein
MKELVVIKQTAFYPCSFHCHHCIFHGHCSNPVFQRITCHRF